MSVVEKKSRLSSGRLLSLIVVTFGLVLATGMAYAGSGPRLLPAAQNTIAGCASGASLLSNHGFEQGNSSWRFYANGNSSWETTSAGCEGSRGATVTVNQLSSNIQLYQSGFTIESGQKYQLTFSAKSNSGNDLYLRLHKHGAPYTAYGLKKSFNLTTDWSDFTTEITAGNFSGTTSDTRLTMLFSRTARTGDIYWIDNVRLEPIGGSSGSPPPAATASRPPAGGGSCGPAEGILADPGFESGGRQWRFHTNASGSFELASPACEGSKAAKINFITTGSNMQLYQSGFSLPAGNYTLRFSAYSSNGHDLRVNLQRHTQPYTNYGLSKTFDLSQEWKEFEYSFSTTGFSGTTGDARLYFWFKGFAAPNETYGVDAVSLVADTDSNPPPAQTPRPTAAPGGGGGGSTGGSCGILAYDWNGSVTAASKGFPREQPPRNNFNWTTPVNYANGTLYYRAEIRDQPSPRNMRLQLCFWQPQTPSSTYKFGNENCGPQKSIQGNPGTVATWSVRVQDMWKHSGRSIDWKRARFRTAVAIKNAQGDPVSNYNGWNWNGENPNLWYPLNMRFTAVVIPAGGNFCGWSHYTDLSD